MRRTAFGWAHAALLVCGAAWGGETVSGRATVIDGDTLRIDGTVIGLFGVAAPGLDQHCESRAGRTILCGAEAAHALSERIGDAGIACETRGLDPYHRTLAICRLGGEDLNAWMVSTGLAVSERFLDAAYFANETKAWGRRCGLWAGVFADPTGRIRVDYALAAKPFIATGDAAERKRPVPASGLKLTGLAK